MLACMEPRKVLYSTPLAWGDISLLYDSKPSKERFMSSTGGWIGLGVRTSVICLALRAFSLWESIATILLQFETEDVLWVTGLKHVCVLNICALTVAWTMGVSVNEIVLKRLLSAFGVRTCKLFSNSC